MKTYTIRYMDSNKDSGEFLYESFSAGIVEFIEKINQLSANGMVFIQFKESLTDRWHKQDEIYGIHIAKER